SSAAVAPAKRRYDRSIVEGPRRPAVWKIEWPTRLTTSIGGLQGMVDNVLVARFAGAADEEKVNRTVYQAFLTAIFISMGIMAPIGYFISPTLLNIVNAAPDVKAEALPFIRIMFMFSIGLMIFFMLSTALRSAGDARKPMMLGISMTVLNLVLNILLIRGLGPIPAFGTKGAAMGTCIASGLIAIYALIRMWS